MAQLGIPAAAAVDDEAFMHEVNLAYERTTLAESICNHDREEDGYCAKCHSWSDDDDET